MISITKCLLLMASFCLAGFSLGFSVSDLIHYYVSRDKKENKNNRKEGT